ncbi:MAG TPA: glycosyltransferase family 4 protein [Blastocatellia bacterium]|jgi:glycosyltransferase involved in cell wall biosynthesis|nr:glycosyltransferase family 4 protein [Blastocatellia bacterium]
MSADTTADHKDGLRAVVFCPGPMGIFEQSLSLQERGWLGTMAIDYYCDLSSPVYRWVSQGRIGKLLRKRYHPFLDARQVRTNLPLAVAARLTGRMARDTQARHRQVFWHNAQFDRWVASRLPAFGNLALGYESSSLFTFRRAKELGLPCVLYQPIACAEKAAALLSEERENFPALADTLRYNWFPEEELERRREERRLADAILCASTFTKQSLIEVGVEAEKIFVEPYGVDQTLFSPSEEKFSNFSVIWAASYTQTKGIGYLLESLAREPVPGVELVLAGYPYGTDAVALYEDRVRVRRIGHLSRKELSQVMRRCHAHVFPTLVEGFGRNIIEAMASGLPVITTSHCAGPDLIEDGVTGFIVPIRDVDAICDKLAWVGERPQEAMEMGARAREAVAHLTQADYRRRFAERVHAIWRGLR